MSGLPSKEAKVVVLGTGGTIAGTAGDARNAVGYRAAQLGVEALLAGLPHLPAVEAEQVAQLDSKDMDHATWLALARRVHHHLSRPDVAGLVVTHGTDTLEETAYFLQHVLAPAKPVVLTAAMRPATALDADGPRNLLDALLLARHPGAQGVVAVLAGQALAADELRKLHTWRLDAFASDGGPVATVADGRVRVLRPWPQSAALGLQALPTDVAHWPRVAVLPSHAGIDGALMSAIVQTLQAQGVDGLVVAGTGNATLHGALRAALQEAQAAGVVVWRATRCPLGPLLGEDEAAPPAADGLSPYQARIALMLALMAQRQRPAAERRKLRPPSA